jgi:hypothetical protein
MRAEIDAGRTPEELDITPDLMEAVKRTADIRPKGMKIDDYLAQQDAFDKYKDDVDALVSAFYDQCTRARLLQQRSGISWNSTPASRPRLRRTTQTDSQRQLRNQVEHAFQP